MCSGSFQGQKKKICFIVVPLLVEEEGGNVGGRGEDRLVFMEIIFLCERKFTEFILWLHKRLIAPYLVLPTPAVLDIVIFIVSLVTTYY